MTTRDLFGLAVRLLGLWALWTALSMILAMIIGPAPFLFGVLVWQAVQFFVGLWMLRGAPPLLDYAYPPDRDGGPYGAASHGTQPFGGGASSGTGTPPRDDPSPRPFQD